MAHTLREARRCGNCSQFPEDWIDERGRAKYYAEATPRVCQGCRELDSVKKEMEKNGTDMVGWSWGWKRRTPGPGRQ